MWDLSFNDFKCATLWARIGNMPYMERDAHRALQFHEIVPAEVPPLDMSMDLMLMLRHRQHHTTTGAKQPIRFEDSFLPDGTMLMPLCLALLHNRHSTRNSQLPVEQIAYHKTRVASRSFLAAPAAVLLCGAASATVSLWTPFGSGTRSHAKK